MELNPTQQKLVEAEPGGYSLIRGVAGSGKTTVALHRTLFLRRNYCFEQDDRILLVTFNRTLIEYLRNLLSKLEETDYYRNIFSSDEQTVDVKTVDSIIRQYSRGNNNFITSNQKVALLTECVVELRKKLTHPLLDQKNVPFLLNEIEWIKACNYMELEEYQHVDRLGRQSFESGEGPQRLGKNSPARRAIYELMLLYNRRLAEWGYDDFQDRALAALQSPSIKASDRYTHIIVDEAQDLTRVQWEFLKRLYNLKKYSSFTVVMDTAQSIYPQAWLVRGRSFTSIGIDMSGRSHILSKSYRNTWQIARSAYKLIENDAQITGDENYVSPVAIDKQGCEPVRRSFESEREEAEYIINTIKELVTEGYTYNEIAVVARMHNQLDYLQRFFEDRKIPYCRPKRNGTPLDNEDAVNLLTLHAIKGLEFRVVFIIGLNERVMPYIPGQVGEEDRKIQESNERKLLYVGMTRATELLFLSSSGPPSPFIENLGQMKLNYRMKIRNLYPVEPEAYLFKDKLYTQTFSSEEKIRQWILKELQHTYGYPLHLLDIEFKVNSFSQTSGSVDIVVFQQKRGYRVPYIFVETKAPGSDLAAGRRQLESYMSNCRTCRFGVLTDGKELLVINHDFIPVDDIPQYTPPSPSARVQQYSYTEVRAPRSRYFTVDGSSPVVILEEAEGAERVYSGDKLVRVPVFQRIAAGAPGFMNDQAVDQFYLPREWVNKSDQLFMLKVHGDSMEGANIFDGDYVLVRKQETAENGDIVVAALAEEATLKEFRKIGDQVFLVPKNKKYKPIVIDSDQARVLGKVFGIVKPRGNLL